MGLTQITTGGVDENINIDSNTLKVDGTNNRVGIGTATPNFHLDVNGNIGLTEGQVLAWHDGSGNKAGDIYMDSSDNIVFRNTSSVNERMRIDSSGRVGIGTASPGSYSSSADELVVAGTTNPGITIAGSSGNTGTIMFADGTSGSEVYRGQIDYQHASDAMVFFTNGGSERMRIDSSGNVGISNTIPSSFQAGGRNLVVGDNSAEHGITIYSTTSGNLYFGDGTSGSAKAEGYIQYLHNTNRFDFGTSNSTRMTIDSSGNVGIGTTSPGARLEVKGAASAGYAAQFTNSTESRFAKIYVDGNGIALVDDNFDDGIEFASNTARIYANGSERMRIDSSGNVGIGTSSIASGGANTRNFNVHTPSANSVYLKLSNSSTGNTASDGFDLSADSSGNAYIINRENNNLYFLTNATTRGRFTSNGRFDVFANSSTDAVFISSGASAGTAVQLIKGMHSATALSGGTNSILIHTNGNIQNSNGSYGSISDVKLKENIVDANSQWDDIKRIQVRNYNFKEETGHETHTQLGVVAQEIETVSPGLVYETPDSEIIQVPVLDENGEAVLDENGEAKLTTEDRDLGTVTKSVNYSVLYMKAVKALQEAMDRIETLETKVAALEAAE